MRRIGQTILILILGAAFGQAAGTHDDQTLGSKYREWLKLTEYIMLPEERDVFKHLETDRDRDVFIQAFWKQRDPTPGTPQNEYREEHTRRFNYANSRLKRSTPREGWQTDMGRVHILLGPPHSIERYDSLAGMFPCQVWYFYGDKKKGLPTYFAILFYQRNGSGEYRIYNPAADGPLSLLVDARGIDISDYRAAYEKVRELAPALAEVSLSLIPGDRPYNYIPSPRNTIILADIFESPTKDVTPTYATHFNNYRGIVSTEYLTNYVESVCQASVVFDPGVGAYFLHFSLCPKRVSFDYYEPRDQYFCNFQLNVSLRQGDLLVYQYSKDYPFYVDPSDLERIKGNGIAIQDSFPVIEGDYRLDILIQNSVGKEFSVSEKNVSIPKAGGPPKIVGPVLGFELKKTPSRLHAPFKLSDRKLEVDPAGPMAASEQVVVFFNLHQLSRQLWESGRVQIGFQGLRDKETPVKTYELQLRDYTYSEVLDIAHSIPAREFVPDYYEVTLTLKNGAEAVIDRESSRFIISPKEIVPHPVTLAKAFPEAQRHLYFYSLAFQYDKAGKGEQARSAYEQALRMKPDFAQGVVEYAHFCLRHRRPEKALELAQRLRGQDKHRFEHCRIQGLAFMQTGRFAEAVEVLEEGNTVYDSDVRLLNALGFCYHQLGRNGRAREVLQASLRLNGEQKSVLELIAELGKDQRDS